MSREEYDKALAEATRKYPAGCTEGWKADVGGAIYHVIEQLPEINLVCVRKTGDPTALIEAQCYIAPTDQWKPEITLELEKAWIEELLFRNSQEWHFVTITPDSLVFDALTVIHDKHYMSIRVIVTNSNTTKSLAFIA